MNEGIADTGRDERLWQSTEVGLDHRSNVVDGVLGEVVKVCSEEFDKKCVLSVRTFAYDLFTDVSATCGCLYLMKAAIGCQNV